MKTNINQPVITVTAQNGTDFTELNTHETQQIAGGSNPPFVGVVQGPNGEGCTGPFWPHPPYQIPYPPFQGSY